MSGVFKRFTGGVQSDPKDGWRERWPLRFRNKINAAYRDVELVTVPPRSAASGGGGGGGGGGVPGAAPPRSRQASFASAWHRSASAAVIGGNTSIAERQGSISSVGIDSRAAAAAAAATRIVHPERDLQRAFLECVEVVSDGVGGSAQLTPPVGVPMENVGTGARGGTPPSLPAGSGAVGTAVSAAVVQALSIEPPAGTAPRDLPWEPVGFAILLSDRRCRVRLYEPTAAMRTPMGSTATVDQQQQQQQQQQSAAATPARNLSTATLNSVGGAAASEGGSFAFSSPGANTDRVSTAPLAPTASAIRDILSAAHHHLALEFDVELPSWFKVDNEAVVMYAGLGVLVFSMRGAPALLYFDLMEVCDSGEMRERARPHAPHGVPAFSVSQQLVPMKPRGASSGVRRACTGDSGSRYADSGRSGTMSIDSATTSRNGDAVLVSVLSLDCRDVAVVTFTRPFGSQRSLHGATPDGPQSPSGLSSVGFQSPFRQATSTGHLGSRGSAMFLALPQTASWQSATSASLTQPLLIEVESAHFTQLSAVASQEKVPALHIAARRDVVIIAPTARVNQQFSVIRARLGAHPHVARLVAPERVTALYAVGTGRCVLAGTCDGLVGVILTEEEERAAKSSGGTAASVSPAFRRQVRLHDQKHAILHFAPTPTTTLVLATTSTGASLVGVDVRGLDDTTRELPASPVRALCRRVAPSKLPETYAVLAVPRDVFGPARFNLVLLVGPSGQATTGHTSRDASGVALFPLMRWRALQQQVHHALRACAAAAATVGGSGGGGGKEGQMLLNTSFAGAAVSPPLQPLPNAFPAHATATAGGATVASDGELMLPPSSRSLAKASPMTGSAERRPPVAPSVAPATATPSAGAPSVLARVQRFFSRRRADQAPQPAAGSSAGSSARELPPPPPPMPLSSSPTPVPAGHAATAAITNDSCVSMDTMRSSHSGGTAPPSAASTPGSILSATAATDTELLYATVPSDPLASFVRGFERSLNWRECRLHMVALDSRLRAFLVCFSGSGGHVALLCRDSMLNEQLRLTIASRGDLGA